MNRWSFLFLSTLASGLVLGCSDDDDDNPTMASGELNPTDDGANAEETSDADDAASDDAASDGAASDDADGDGAASADAPSADAAGDDVDGDEADSADAPSGEGGSLSFFVTSVGSGEVGGNLGGLEGADAMCQELAEAAGAGARTWRAYLSTDTENAIDRIGAGPWFNAEGVQVASDVDDLLANGISNGDPQLILDETGEPAPANEHDILTGTNEDGTAAVGLNCDNWTSNSAELTENPRVGHSDIPGNPMFSPSWNSAHVSANCSAEGLQARGGAGRLYCFAAD